jgi:hypothetical protein
MVTRACVVWHVKSATAEKAMEEVALGARCLSGTLLAKSAGWVTKNLSRQRRLRAMRRAPKDKPP